MAATRRASDRKGHRGARIVSAAYSLRRTCIGSIAAALRGRPASQWVRAAQQLSERYRGERASGDERLARTAAHRSRPCLLYTSDAADD